MFILGLATVFGVLLLMAQLGGLNYALIFDPVNLVFVLLPAVVFATLTSSNKHKRLCLTMLVGKSVDISDKDKAAVLRTVRVLGNSSILFGMITLFIGVTAIFENSDNLSLSHLRDSITLHLHYMVLPLYLKTFALLSEAWINSKFE